jgi:hypothetical protein
MSDYLTIHNSESGNRGFISSNRKYILYMQTPIDPDSTDNSTQSQGDKKDGGVILACETGYAK